MKAPVPLAIILVTAVAVVIGANAFRIRPWFVGLLVAAALFGSTTLAVLSSSAQQGCPAPSYSRPDIYGNWFDGWYRWPGHLVQGASAYLFNYDPFPWPPENGHSLATVMLVNHENFKTWAQVGYVKRYWYDELTGGFDGPYVNTFVQITTPEYPNFDTFFFPPQPRGIFREYRIEYSGTFSFWVDGSGLGTLPNYFQPDEAQMFGEVTNAQSQMPGGQGTPEVFQLAMINTGGGWQPFDGSDGGLASFWLSNPNWFFLQQISNNQLHIWDWYCY